MLSTKRSGLLLILLLLLAGCTQAAQPTPSPVVSSTAVVASSPPTTTAPAPTATQAVELTPSMTPSPTSEPARLPSPEAEPTLAPLVQAAAPALSEHVVLQLSAGSGPGQVATMPNPLNPNVILAPTSFRIGADGTIRILDAANKRVLFFAPDGKPGRVQPVTEAVNPVDFIVNNNAEVFVLDSGTFDQATKQDTPKQVLLYSASGKLSTRYPIAASLFPDGIMLNSNQDLFVVRGSLNNNPTATVLLSAGKPVDLDHQMWATHRGLPTPRSPTLFLRDAHPGSVNGVGLDVSLANPGDEIRLALNNLELPGDSQFLNIDQAMNMYFMKLADNNGELSIWQVRPDSIVWGGGNVDTTGCQNFTWRSIYVSQDGEIWRMCTRGATTTVSRYNLIGTAGQLLGKVEKLGSEAASSIPWAPGGKFTAA